MGMAAEANRITYGNWRLPCGAAAFFIHKTISRNGGINMKELWNTAQVIFAAIGGCAAYMAACVEALEVVAYDDLGTESIKRLTVRDLPLTVALDAQGGDAYAMGAERYRELCQNP